MGRQITELWTNNFLRTTFETTEPNRGVGLSFWKTKEEAESYHREVFPELAGSV